jgi:phthalate 4,5-cis-dihydrodiol dehydrogenase
MALGVGLIGCGGMGRELARAVRDSVPEAEVVVGCDSFPPARARFSEECGAVSALSLEELLARDDVQAVLIASPNHLHCEHALAAAAAGKHVFCEKPMALSVADCDRMITACRAAGVKLMVGHSTRLHPTVRKLREIVSHGDLGEPVYGCATYFFSGFRPRESGIWHVNRAQSGGVLFHMGIHHIDLFHAILGPSRRVHYAGGRHGDQARDFDDIASILVEYVSGATGAISVAGICPVPLSETTVIFSRGYARFRDHFSELASGSDADRLSRVTRGDLPGPGAVELELSSYARWALDDEPPVLTAAEGRAAVAVAEAAQEAEKQGIPVPVAEAVPS